MLQKIEDLEMETNAMRNELFILWNKAISATNNPADNNVRVLNHTCFMKGQRNCKIKCNLLHSVKISHHSPCRISVTLKAVKLPDSSI